MNYELAKQLKDAGFPQHGNAEEWLHKEGGRTFDTELAQDYPNQYAYAPTLSELIEACGEGFRDVCRSKDGYGNVYWIVNRDDMWNSDYPDCKTAEEAVARLYIALNKK